MSTSNVTTTATVPSTNVALHHIQAAFPGVGNKLSQYYGLHPSLPTAGAIKFSAFKNITAPVPTVSSLSSMSVPIVSSNVTISATGLISGIAGPSVTATGSINLASFLDVPQYLRQTTITLYPANQTLPTGVSFSSSTSVLTINTNASTNGIVPLTFKLGNFFGNYCLFRIQVNIVSAATSDPAVTQVAVFTGESFNPSTSTWIDSTGAALHAQWAGGSNATVLPFGPNSRMYLVGSTANSLTLPGSIAPSNQTIFTVARYDPASSSSAAASNNAIFCSSNLNWISGFSSNSAGVAVHGGCNVTPGTSFLSGTGTAASSWILSTDQSSLYRANGLTMSTAPRGSAYEGAVGINLSGRSNSPFHVANISVLSGNMSLAQIQATESNLAGYYGLCISLSSALPPQTLSNNSAAVNVAGYFLNATSYSAASTYSNVSISAAGVMTVTGANRNASYPVTVTASNALSVARLSCAVADVAAMQQFILPVAGVLAVYTSQSLSNSIWYDVSGNGYNATCSGAVSSVANQYVYGPSNASVAFPTGVLPATYTMFHVARYNGGPSKRVVTSSDGTNYLSGFYNGCAGVAYHNNWLTASTDQGLNSTGSNWILSTDQNALYRANGLSGLTTGAQGTPSYCKLGVNTFSSEASAWAVSYLAVYSGALTLAQIQSVESSLATYYGIPLSKNAQPSAYTFSSSTLSTTVNLANYVSNATTFSITANPLTSASISGSTLTVINLFSGQTYAVAVQCAGSSGAIVNLSLTVTEPSLSALSSLLPYPYAFPQTWTLSTYATYAYTSWTVPVTAVYNFSVAGGQGGNYTAGNPTASGGYGMIVSGGYLFYQGETLSIAIGTQGGSYNTTGYGYGGGGSFLVLSSSNNTPILIGGGGGGTASTNGQGINGNAAPAAQYDPAGTTGLPGYGGTYSAGGGCGGGFYTSGATSTNVYSASWSGAASGSGGAGWAQGLSEFGKRGTGGGGCPLLASLNNVGGGGGGGYSGGNGGAPFTAGYGGGSYFSPLRGALNSKYVGGQGGDGSAQLLSAYLAIPTFNSIPSPTNVVSGALTFNLAQYCKTPFVAFGLSNAPSNVSLTGGSNLTVLANWNAAGSPYTVSVTASNLFGFATTSFVVSENPTPSTQFSASASAMMSNVYGPSNVLDLSGVCPIPSGATMVYTASSPNANVSVTGSNLVVAGAYRTLSPYTVSLGSTMTYWTYTNATTSNANTVNYAGSVAVYEAQLLPPAWTTSPIGPVAQGSVKNVNLASFCPVQPFSTTVFTAVSPIGNASVSGSNLAITPSNNPPYSIALTASNAAGYAAASVAVTEANPRAYWNVAGLPSLIGLTAGSNVVNLAPYSIGATSYTASSVYNDVAISSSNLVIFPDYRGTGYPYTVSVTASNAYGSTTIPMLVTESNLPPPVWTAIPSSAMYNIVGPSNTLNVQPYCPPPPGYVGTDLTYTVVTSPYSNAAISSSSNVVVSANYRGVAAQSTYSIVLGASNLFGYATTVLSVTEAAMPAPSAVSTVPSQLNLNTGNDTIVISSYFSGPSLVYSVTSNPQNNATISGSSLTIAANYRNTSYIIQIAATNACGTAYQNVSVSESMQPPSVVSTMPSQLNLTTGTTNVTLDSYFGGPSLTYSVSSPYGNCTVSGSTLSIVAAYRNTSYTVTVTATNAGGSKQQSFTTSESVQPPVCVNCSGTYNHCYFNNVGSSSADTTGSAYMNPLTGIGWVNNGGMNQLLQYTGFYTFSVPYWKATVYYNVTFNRMQFTLPDGNNATWAR